MSLKKKQNKNNAFNVNTFSRFRLFGVRTNYYYFCVRLCSRLFVLHTLFVGSQTIKCSWPVLPTNGHYRRADISKIPINSLANVVRRFQSVDSYENIRRRGEGGGEAYIGPFQTLAGRNTHGRRSVETIFRHVGPKNTVGTNRSLGTA